MIDDPLHELQVSLPSAQQGSRPLIIKDGIERAAGLRIPAGEIDPPVTSRVADGFSIPAASTRRVRRGSLILQRSGGLPRESRRTVRVSGWLHLI